MDRMMPPMDPAQMMLPGMGPQIPPGGIPQPPPGLPPGMGMGGPEAPMLGASAAPDPLLALGGGMMGPPPGGPPPGMSIGGMNPMAAALMALLPKMQEVVQEVNRKPTRKKPTRSEIVTLARKDQGDYQTFRDVVADTRSRLALATSAVFNSDVALVRAKRIEPFQLTALRDEFDNGKTWLSGHNARIKDQARSPQYKEIGQKKVDFSHYFHGEEKAQHLTQYAEDYDLAESAIAMVTGRLAGIDLIDPWDEECPLTMSLLDPTTVFPTFGGPKEGLIRCTIVRRALLGDVLGRYDPTGEIGQRLYGMIPSSTTRADRKDSAAKAEIEGAWGPNSDGELIEWYDQDYRAVLWNEEWIVEPTEHQYGEVPITYVMSPVGDSLVLSSAPYARKTEVANGRFEYVTADPTKQSIMSSTGLPFTWFSHILHDQQEAVFTRLYNEIRISNNRPKYVKLGFNSTKDSFKWTTTAGATNFLEPGDDIGWEPTAPEQAVLMPILQSFSQSLATNRIPLSAFGQAPSQTSGFAMENQNETGRERLSGWLRMKANFRRLRMEKRLRYFMKHGGWMGNPDIDGIELPFRFPRPGTPEMFTLTPDELRKAGTRLDVTMTNLRLSNLGNLGNAVGIWKGQLELMSDEKALELREEDDIEGELMRIELDKIRKDPLLHLPKLVRMLVAQGQDEEAAFILEEYRTMKQQKDMERMAAMMGGDPTGGGGGGGMIPPSTGGGGQTMPQGPGGPSPAQAQGLSLPGLGMPPGQSTGRPPQGPQGPVAQAGLPGM